MEKLNKINKMHLFIILLPIIDFIISICTWNGLNSSIGLLIKGIFLAYAIIYLLKNKQHRKIFIVLSLYLIIYFAYLFTNNLNIIKECTNLIKIFYLPILILFFSEYQNEKINKKTITFVFLLYLLLYLIPFIFGLGHNISEVYPNKDLYLSYFYIGNELANVFILLLPISLIYLIESNSYLLKGLFLILILCTCLLMSTKTFYISILIILIYFAITRRKYLFKLIKRNSLKFLIGILAILLGLIVYLPKMDLTKNIKTSLEYYNVDSISSLCTIENIDNVIFSSRLTFLNNVNKYYGESSNHEKLLGLSRSKIDTIKNVEIDIFDIFYSIGIIGSSFYLIFFIYSLKQTKMQKDYKFTFILLLFISCFTGHVLISPFVTTWLAMLVLISKNDYGKTKKNILLVSNMYPNNKYPHYGIFVKNTEDLLKENGLTIDKVILHKQDSKVKKIITYLVFYIKSFILSLINNYDYIYVHFISHSTLGILLPFITSKKTKLVLNVHGNDIVADTKIDNKNIKKSSLYLKYANIVISPSKYFEQVLIKEYKVPKNKIVIYPSGGVDTEKFKKIDKNTAKKNVNLSTKIKYFGYISRIEKDKGYDILLEAIKEIKNIKDVKFLIIGSGSEEYLLDELITKYDLQEIIIRKSFVNQKELVNIYNSIEALIYPTRRKSESLGLTGLEAMACETLVIGSNKYGPSDYLENNINSKTFNPTNHKELAKLIEETLNMKELEKNKLTKEARKKSLEYNNENTKEIILNVFKADN